LTHQTYTLLIVEDAPTDLELYRRLLLKDPNGDYELLEAETVGEGLEFCRKRSIDVILLDYQLPDGNGLQFITALAAQSGDKLPPVVMLTGQGDENIAVRAMKLGAQDYLVKSNLTPELLQLSIHKAISSDRFRQQLAQIELAKIEAETERDRFFNLSIDLLATASFEGYFLRLNPAWEKLLGFDNAELMAQPYLDLVHPDDLEATVAAAKGIGTGTAVIEFENRYRCQDGSYRWLLWNSTPDVEQNVTYAIAHDITDRKQREIAGIAADQERDRFFNLSLDLLAIGSFDGYFTRLNPACEQVLGFTNAELMAEPFISFVHPDDRERTIVGAQSLLNGEPIASFENRYRCKDGSYRWILWNAIPYPPNQVWYAIGHDISLLKQQEGDLRESQERLQTGIEVAGVGLARFDYKTNLVALSPEAAVLYGFDSDIAFVTREQIHATFHPDERARLEATIAKVIDPAGTGWFAQDHRVVWPSGEVRCLSVRKQVFFVDKAASGENPDGAVPRPSYAILAAIDITERQQTQANLEQRNQELDSFVHIVSHDLKAPLRAVSNLSQWIEEDLEGSLTAANQEQMNLLRARIERMSSTIDGLLDYARIGRTADSIEPVVIADLIAEIVDSLAPPPTFTIEIAQNLPTLQTKRLLLSQVFANLIGNGVKHHDRIDGLLHIGITERQDFYEFTIADDGPGIALEDLEKIFTIFQAVNPQNRNDSTGIGLAIVKKIVEAEGGTIRLESQVGKGTTFYFTWPK
jgi:PAS domain S-box-containing protein